MSVSRRVASLPLAVSAVLKFGSDAWAADLIVVAGLIALVVWLWVGRNDRPVLAITGGVFLLFATYNLISVIRGESDCGCFGSVRVSLWHMMAADLVLAAGLLWLARLHLDVERLKSVCGLGLVAVGVVALLVPVLAAAAGTALRDAGSDRGLWLTEVETDAELDRGSWEIVLVRHNCGKCEQFARNLGAPARASRRVIVEMEPYSADAGKIMAWTDADAYGRLPMAAGLPLDAAPRLFVTKSGVLE